MSEHTDLVVRIHVESSEDAERAIEAMKEQIKAIPAIALRRLMYGEWEAIECADCHSREHVHLYRLNGVHPKITVHLCDACFQKTPIASHIREWEPGDR